MTDTSELLPGCRLATLRVLDAQFYDNADGAEVLNDPTYECGIDFEFQDTETDFIFVSRCNSELIAELSEMDGPLRSGAIRRLANWWRNDTDPITLYVEDGKPEIDTLLIQRGEKLRRRVAVKKEDAIQKFSQSIIQPAVTIGFRRFRSGAFVPTKGTEYAAGYDLYAWAMTDVNAEMETKSKEYSIETFGMTDREYVEEYLQNLKSINDLVPAKFIIPPGEMRLVKTGLNVAIPEGYQIEVRPRSGLAAKHQITVMNSPGTIDADYDGDGEKFEIKVMLHNAGPKPFLVTHGDRIAQAVIMPVPKVVWVERHSDNMQRLESNRDSGLGSTGKK